MHQIRCSAPEPAGGAYSAPQPPRAVFKGPASKGRVGEGEEKRRGGKGEGREEGKRREGGKRRGSSHAFCFSNLGSSARGVGAQFLLLLF